MCVVPHPSVIMYKMFRNVISIACYTLDDFSLHLMPILACANTCGIFLSVSCISLIMTCYNLWLKFFICKVLLQLIIVKVMYAIIFVTISFKELYLPSVTNFVGAAYNPWPL